MKKVEVQNISEDEAKIIRKLGEYSYKGNFIYTARSAGGLEEEFGNREYVDRTLTSLFGKGVVRKSGGTIYLELTEQGVKVFQVLFPFSEVGAHTH